MPLECLVSLKSGVLLRGTGQGRGVTEVLAIFDQEVMSDEVQRSNEEPSAAAALSPWSDLCAGGDLGGAIGFEYR